MRKQVSVIAAVVMLVFGQLDLMALCQTRPVNAMSPVQVSVQYRPDAVRLLTDYRRIWTRQHPGVAMTRTTLAEEAMKAYLAAANTNESELYVDAVDSGLVRRGPVWQLAGSVHPWVMVPRITVTNPSNESAWLNVTVTADVLAHVGEWLVDNITYTTDTAHLESSGQWMRISEHTWKVPALVPEQTERWTTKPIELLALLDAVSKPNEPSHWINRVVVRVTVSAHGQAPQTTETVLPLQPDYFAVPYWY